MAIEGEVQSKTFTGFSVGGAQNFSLDKPTTNGNCLFVIYNGWAAGNFGNITIPSDDQINTWHGGENHLGNDVSVFVHFANGSAGIYWAYNITGSATPVISMTIPSGAAAWFVSIIEMNNLDISGGNPYISSDSQNTATGTQPTSGTGLSNTQNDVFSCCAMYIYDTTGVVWTITEEQSVGWETLFKDVHGDTEWAGQNLVRTQHSQNGVTQITTWNNVQRADLSADSFHKPVVLATFKANPSLPSLSAVDVGIPFRASIGV